MQHSLHTLIAIIATAGLCFGLAAYFDTGSYGQSITLANDEMRTVRVVGEAERFVAPDTASLSFTITRRAATIGAATDSVNTRMAELLSYMESFGIEEKDIQTKNYNLNPEYRYEGETRNRIFDGYRINQSIAVVVRDLDNLEKVISGIGTQGVDGFSGPRFYVENDEEIREELRKEAIAHAKEKAKILGKDLGVRLDTIVGFSESGVPVQFDYAKTRMSGLAVEESVDANIPVGEDRLRASVTISFEIE